MINTVMTEAEFGARASAYGVLTKFHGGLHRYLEHRIETGGFLRAVLEFDRGAAIERADGPTSRVNISNIVAFLRHEFPVQSYGSAANVRKWLDRKHD